MTIRGDGGLKHVLAVVGLLLALSAALSLVGSAAAQCDYPLGWFASEVILNKPGVTYDLTKLRETGNMTEVGPSLLYRSHYDPRIAVILTPLKVYSEEGLDVWLQMPTREVTITTQYMVAETTDYNLKVADLMLMGGKDLGWVLDLSYLPRPIGEAPLQISNLTKGNIRVTIIPVKNETFPGAYIRIAADNVTALTKQNRTELSKIFEAIRYPTSFEELAKGLNFVSLNRTRKDLTSAIGIHPGTFKWEEAMKLELQWLRRNRVISGLTDDDIDKIGAVAPFAWGAHNFKTRYYNGRWIPGINEEMLEANVTRYYQGPPDCRPFDLSLLPSVDVVDFNASVQPVDILSLFAEQSYLGAGIRAAVVVAAAGSLLFLFRRRIRWRGLGSRRRRR